VVCENEADNGGNADEPPKPENADDGDFLFPVHAKGFDEWNREAEDDDVKEHG